MEGVLRFSPVLISALYALICPTHALADQGLGDPSPASATAEVATPAEDVANPAGGGGSSVIVRVEAPARHKQRLVFACREGSVPVFSDRPCGDGARSRRLDFAAPVIAAGGSTPSTRAPAPTASTRPIVSSAPREEPAPPDACTRLEEALAAIDARMREGYSARESARLWERWRAAKAKLHDARC